MEQAGAAIFDRAVLRLTSWPSLPPATLVLLRRVSAGSYEGVRRYTRSKLAITHKSQEEIGRIWPELTATGWSGEDLELVLAGEVRKGMTPDQVRLSWGVPKSEVGSAEVPGTDIRWDYADRSAVFVNRALASWSLAGEPERPAPLPRCPGIAPPSRPAR